MNKPTKVILELGDIDDVWCERCFANREAYKCHLTIGRPEHGFLDDNIYRKRPQECRDMEITIHDECDCDCKGTFICSKCKRKIGYCFGGDGDELCNDCWHEQQKSQGV